MHLIAVTKPQPAPAPTDTDVFVGSALVLVFAETEAIAQLRADGHGPVALEPPYHLGEEDTYLLLPSDIGEEIVDILGDGDAELLREAMRDGLLVQGEIGRSPRGRGMVLHAEQVQCPMDVLAPGVPHAAQLALTGEPDVLRALNTLPHVQCTTLSALVDEEGLEQILQARDEYIGCAWKLPASARHLSSVEPTYVWSRRAGEGRVDIELALFREDEELVAVLRPASLTF